MPVPVLTPADDSGNGWFHTSPPRCARPGHSGRSAARWVVVGAGLTGLAGKRDELIDFLLSGPGPNGNPPEPLLSVGVNFNLAMGQYRAGREA